MARTVAFSNAFKTGAVDLTATPQIALTNNSTYTAASNLAAVTAEEVSGNGYARINLTVNSNTVTVQGFGQIVYNTATVTASGGNIVFDRAAIIADSEFVGYTVFGTTTINDGVSYPFPLPTLILRESGTVLTGSNGVSATTTSTASFTQPAVSATVTVAMVSTAWLAVGSNVYFTNGTNVGWYEVTAIDSPTSATLENLGLSGSAVATTVMTVGTFVCTGIPGATGATGAPASGLPYTFSATTSAPPSSGEIRLNNASPASATTMWVHETDRNSKNLSNFLTLFTGAQVILTDEDTPTTYAYYIVNSITDAGTYKSVSVSHVGSNGTFSGSVRLFYNNSPSGSSGSFLDYTLYLDKGTPDPTAGQLWTDDATTASVTTLYAHETDRDSLGIGSILANLTPGSTFKIAGDTSGVKAYFRLDKIVDNGAYQTYTVSHIASTGNLFDAEKVSVTVLPPDRTYTAISANATLSAVKSLPYFVDASAGNITLTIPLSATATSKIDHLIKRIDDGTAGYSVTLARSGSDLIDGETSQTLSAYEAVNVRADGVSNWWVY